MEASRSKVARGVAWMGGARIVVNLVSFASTLLLARLLTPEDFGLVAIVMAVAMIVSSITELSLNQALIKLDNPQDADFRTAWTLNIARAALLAAFMLAAAMPAAHAYGEDRLVGLFLAMAGGTFIGALENPKVVIFQRDLIFSRDFVLIVIERIVASIVAVTIAWLYGSYWALILGTIVANFARVAMSYMLIPFRPWFSLASARSLLSFSLWLTAASVVKTVNQRSIPLVIGAVLPTSAVGLYSLADRISTIPVRESIGALQRALYPAYARMADDIGRLQNAYLRAQTMTSMIALPAGIGIAAVAKPVVLILLEEKWLPAVPLIQIIAFASAIASIQNALPLAMALGRPNELLHRNVRTFLVLIPLLFLGYWVGSHSEIGGLIGIVIGQGIAWLVNIALNMGLVSKVAQISIARQLAAVSRTITSALAMLASVLWATPHLPTLGLSPSALSGLICLIILGGLTYAGALMLLCAIFRRNAKAEWEMFGMAADAFRRISRRLLG